MKTRVHSVRRKYITVVHVFLINAIHHGRRYNFLPCVLAVYIAPKGHRLCIYIQEKLVARVTVKSTTPERQRNGEDAPRDVFITVVRQGAYDVQFINNVGRPAKLG